MSKIKEQKKTLPYLQIIYNCNELLKQYKKKTKHTND